MRKRKVNYSGNSSKKKYQVMTAIIVFLSIIAALLFVVIAIFGVLKKAPYFTVTDVIVMEGDKSNFSHLIGRNIFDIDLSGETEYISQLYPSFKKVRLIRVLPDKIFVDFKSRQALAYIKLYRNFAVDEDCVLLEVPQGQDVTGLPVITGLDTKIFGPKLGVKYNVGELKFAVNVLRQFRSSRGLRDYPLTRIDVSRPGQVSVFISDSLEIRINKEKAQDMMSILPGLLWQAKSDLANIEYIDLRFREPLIKFKNVKK